MKKVSMLTCFLFVFIYGTNARIVTTEPTESIVIGNVKNNIAEITFNKTELEQALTQLFNLEVILFETSIFYENQTYTLIGKAKSKDGSTFAKIMIDLSVDDRGNVNVNKAAKPRVCVSHNGCNDCISDGNACACSYGPNVSCSWQNWGGATALTLYDLLK